MSSEDSDKIFEVISHRIRRAIIESIAEKGPRSFTELMEDADVRDTGTMTFHLRKMSGFIRKNEKGLYELTDLGRRAYEVIKVVKKIESLSRESVRETSDAERSQAVSEKKSVTEEGGDLVVLSDALKIVIDKDLLEKIRSRGKRLIVTDAVNVEVSDDVDPHLFEEVVEEISDVVSLRVPEKLRSIAQIKARDVLHIGTRAPGRPQLDVLSWVTDAIESIVSSTASIVTRVVSSIPHKIFAKEQTLIHREKFQEIDSLHLDLSGVRLEIESGESADTEVSVYGDERCDYDLETKNSVLKIDASSCRVVIKTPNRELRELVLDASGASISIDLRHGVKILKGSISGGVVSTRINGLRASDISLRTSGGKIDMSLGYAEFEGRSEISIELAGGVLDLETRVPSSVGVAYRIDRLGGWASVDVDKDLMRIERPRGVIEAELELSGGFASIKFKKSQ